MRCNIARESKARTAHMTEIDEIPNWTGPDLVAWRNTHELTQEQAAAVLDVSKRQIAHIELGAAQATSSMKLIADFITSVADTSHPRKLWWHVDCHGTGFIAHNDDARVVVIFQPEEVIGLPQHVYVSPHRSHPDMTPFELQQDAMREIFVRYKEQNHHLREIAHVIGYNNLPQHVEQALVSGSFIQRDSRGYWSLTLKGRKRIGRRGRIMRPAP